MESLLHRILAAYPEAESPIDGAPEQVNCIPMPPEPAGMPDVSACRCPTSSSLLAVWFSRAAAVSSELSLDGTITSRSCKHLYAAPFARDSSSAFSDGFMFLASCAYLGRLVQAPEQTPVQQTAAHQDDAFWDQRAPSPPSDFDPFASRAAAATPPSALGMMTPGPPAPPSAPAMSTTPPKSPGNFLRGALQEQEAYQSRDTCSCNSCCRPCVTALSGRTYHSLLGVINAKSFTTQR